MVAKGYIPESSPASISYCLPSHSFLVPCYHNAVSQYYTQYIDTDLIRMPLPLKSTSHLKPIESSLESDDGDNLIKGMMAVQPSLAQFTKAQ